MPKVKNLKTIAVEAVYKAILSSLKTKKPCFDLGIENPKVMGDSYSPCPSDNEIGLWNNRKMLKKGRETKKKRKSNKRSRKCRKWIVTEPQESNKSYPEAKKKIPSQSLITAVREKLDECLVGRFGKIIRQELWKHFINHKLNEEQPDLCLFLGSILNGNSFNTLSISQQNLPPNLFDKEDNFYLIQLVETVAHYCPTLQEIAFNINTIRCNSFPISSEALWAKSFSSLTKLTKLELNWITDTASATQFLTHLGYSCPKLKVLKIRKMPFLLDQQLALILGKKAEIFSLYLKEEFHEVDKNNLAEKLFFYYRNRTQEFPKYLLCLKFKEKDMTPISRSLLHLTSKSQDKVSQQEQMHCSLFLLRHFPQLQKLVINVEPNELTQTTSGAVNLLYQSQIIQFIEASFKKKQIKWNMAPSNLSKKLLVLPKPIFYHFILS